MNKQNAQKIICNVENFLLDKLAFVWYNNISKGDDPYERKELIIMASITKIYKTGSIIYIEVSDKDKPYTFNCSTHELVSYAGRKLKTSRSLCSNRMCSSLFERNVIRAISLTIDDYNSCYLKKIELFFGAPELVRTGLDGLPNECPKGYISWLRENDITISQYSLSLFKTAKKLESLTKEHRDFYETLKEHYNRDWNDCVPRYFLEDNSVQKTKIIQIFKVSAKELRWELKDDFENFMKTLDEKAPENWENYVDANRNFEYNIELLDQIKNKERNEKIIAFESLFTEVETLSNDNYTIVVPRNMKDFTDEGKQQNNCVGYYYHDSIAAHNNFIYFIRRTSNPNKSYITNRFNLRYNETVESRICNNDDVEDKLAMELIREIDRKINEIIRTKNIE